MWNDDERALDSIQYTFEVRDDPDISVPVMCKQIGDALAAIPRELCYISVSAYPPPTFQMPLHVNTVYTPSSESQEPSSPVSSMGDNDNDSEELNSDLLEVSKFATT